MPVLRNVTLALPDDVYRQARIAAAERDLSMSAWVRELLVEAMSSGRDFARRKKLQDETIASIDRFDGGDRLTRDELYRR